MNQVKTLPGLLDKMWRDYVEINPLAEKIAGLFTAQGEVLQNDHIALRTFNLPRVGLEVMAKPFTASGYVYKGDYHFPEKKLYAKHWEHPDETLPKIFISELLVEKFSPKLQATVRDLVDQIPEGGELAFDFVSGGRPWEVTSRTYQELLEESDYAAWVAAFGFRPNHFTVFINALKKYSDIRTLNDYLKSQGIQLNSSGGEVKGTKELCLEQSSTLANTIEVSFADRKMAVPACYYEFAKRYPAADGKLYHGFVAASADKIFESTSRGQ